MQHKTQNKRAKITARLNWRKTLGKLRKAQYFRLSLRERLQAKGNIGTNLKNNRRTSMRRSKVWSQLMNLKVSGRNSIKENSRNWGGLHSAKLPIKLYIYRKTCNTKGYLTTLRRIINFSSCSSKGHSASKEHAVQWWQINVNNNYIVCFPNEIFKFLILF